MVNAVTGPFCDLLGPRFGLRLNFPGAFWAFHWICPGFSWVFLGTLLEIYLGLPFGFLLTFFGVPPGFVQTHSGLGSGFTDTLPGLSLKLLWALFGLPLVTSVLPCTRFCPELHAAPSLCALLSDAHWSAFCLPAVCRGLFSFRFPGLSRVVQCSFAILSPALCAFENRDSQASGYDARRLFSIATAGSSMP